MKARTGLTWIAAALACGVGVGAGAWAASAEDRTSMPDRCSDRNANCVIDDGPAPPYRAGPPDSNLRPIVPVPTPQPGRPASGAAFTPGGSATDDSGTSGRDGPGGAGRGRGR